MWKSVMLLATAGVLATGTAAALRPRDGGAIRITTDRETEEHGNRPQSAKSSATDRDSYVERVIATRPDGVVLEYDLPPDTAPAARTDAWQFPFRVLKRADGSLQLLDAAELNGRVDRWLRRAGLSRAACGTEAFTWNAFRVECDPQSAVAWATSVTLPDRLAAGSSVSDPDALSPALLRRGPAGALTATLAVDPTTIRRRRAEEQVAVARLLHEPLTLDAALKAHEAETVTGTITLSFDLDPTGGTGRRSRVEVVQVAWPDGRVDTRTSASTLTREPLAAGEP